MMSHLINIYAVCKFSYFHVWYIYLKSYMCIPPCFPTICTKEKGNFLMHCLLPWKTKVTKIGNDTELIQSGPEVIKLFSYLTQLSMKF